MSKFLNAIILENNLQMDESTTSKPRKHNKNMNHVCRYEISLKKK